MIILHWVWLKHWVFVVVVVIIFWVLSICLCYCWISSKQRALRELFAFERTKRRAFGFERTKQRAFAFQGTKTKSLARALHLRENCAPAHMQVSFWCFTRIRWRWCVERYIYAQILFTHFNNPHWECEKVFQVLSVGDFSVRTIVLFWVFLWSFWFFA